jgi:secreted PhoX family phosphatase
MADEKGPRSPAIARRTFLKHGSMLAGAAVPLVAFMERTARANNGVRRGQAGYGPLRPTKDLNTGLPLLWVPEGFHYVSFGWRGDLLDDGTPTPAAHDGMAAYDAGKGVVTLVRNHEISTDDGGPFTNAGLAYDIGAGGGTSNIQFDTHKKEVVGAWASLSGTIRNCAGGSTPWNSWLTCEETTDRPDGENPLTQKHGYIFDVAADGVGNPVPFVSMGRFSHEAVAIDRRTWWVYETEDQGTTSGFYRYVPTVKGDLSSGVLYMLKVVGEDKASFVSTGDTSAVWPVEWVSIDDPDAALESVWTQGRNKGAATFARLEGAWWGNDRVYFISTSGAPVRQGQVFEYDPVNETLKLTFASPDASVLNAPDNMCVSPRGGLVLCEDGGGEEFVHGLTTEGKIFKLVKNSAVLDEDYNEFVPADDYSGSEFAGSVFSPDGKWLFFNIQNPGITFAMTGPWGQKGV